MHESNHDSALLQAVMTAAVDAIIVADHTGRIVRANSAAYQMFQYAPDELTGQNVSVLMPDALASLHDGFIRHHIDTGEKRIIGIGRDVEGKRKDKSIFPLHLSVGETTVDGEPMFVGILHNLTQRNATQEALARSQRLDAIGQMTGGISHDFNNILTVVIGNLELLQQRGIDDRQASLVKDALESAEMGAELTSRLMVFARKSNLKPERSDLRILCEDTLAILRRTLGSGFKIRTDFAQDLDMVLVDPVQLQSALMNLALNARDAMGKKGEFLISIENVSIDDTYIAQETDIEPGNYVRLSISDDGAGMSIESQRRAFEPFFTTKSDNGGTGLGLAMVYGFVRQSGGHVTLYSELGFGTSFGLYFPAALPAEGETAQQVSKAKAVPQGDGQVVLVVEDNPKVRKLSLARIQDLGFVTEEAADGDEALKLLESGRQIDVVFSDLVMPGELSGYDLAARITSDFPGIRILLTSGYASDVVTGSMAHDVVYDILHKPYRQADLAQRLHALLADDPSP